MLTELKEGTMVRGCLSNAKQLKTVDDWKKVFITPDLDKQERLRNKELREELRRRMKDGEENLIIHKGKNCRRKESHSEALPYRGHQGQTWASRLSVQQEW